jgi:hypothetical protein
VNLCNAPRRQKKKQNDTIQRGFEDTLFHSQSLGLLEAEI